MRGPAPPPNPQAKPGRAPAHRWSYPEAMSTEAQNPEPETAAEAAAADAPATQRMNGFLALPHHMALGARLLWDSADALWRWAGDTATDENHYSKRMILSGVLGPAIAIRLASGRAAAEGYVFRR